MNNDTSGSETTERGFGEVLERETSDDSSEDTQDEQVEDISDSSSDDNSDQADDQQGDEGEEDENEDDPQQPKQEKTEKGTKLDPNPKSAVHQQLANERRVRGQMEQVLADPKLMAKFMQEQYGITVDVSQKGGQPSQQETTQTAKPNTKWTAKDFESLEDVAEKFNGLQEQFTTEISKRDEEIKGLKGQLGGLSERGKIMQLADNLEGDVKALSQEPELIKNGPEFIPGLEDQIGALYHKLDFDEASGVYRGNYSLREIGQSIIETARTAKKAGSLRAQTIIKDKTGGKIRTGNQGKDIGKGRDELPPAQSIAQGISKMFR